MRRLSGADWVRIGAGILLLSAVAGCGYTTRSMVINRYRTIAIEPVVNKIDITRDSDAANKYQINWPALETDLTRAVINKFLVDGNLRVVREDEADVVLKTDLVQFRRDPLRYSENDDVDEYRVNIVVNLVLWDKRDNKEIWREGGFTGDVTYFPTTSTLQSVTKKSDTQAISEAVTDLARRIVERAVEDW